MLPAPFLLAAAATFTTFGPIAQTTESLFVADHGSIVRVDKSDTTKRVTLTAPTTRRVTAIDVVGDRVFYATAPAPRCTSYPLFPPQTLYVGYDCVLVDTDSRHELRSASVFGDDDKLFFSSLNGFTEIAHDDQWIYWLEPSTALFPTGGHITRTKVSGGGLETPAEGLVVSAVNQHPFVLSDDAIYVVSGSRLLKFPKSGSASGIDLARVNVDTSISASDGTLYFVDGAKVYALDMSTDRIVEEPYLVSSYCGATYPIGVLGAAPGYRIGSEGSGCTNTAFHGWYVADVCNNQAALLGSVTSDRINSYFIPPLADPPIAVDSNGVWSGANRVYTFSHGACRRRVVTSAGAASVR